MNKKFSLIKKDSVTIGGIKLYRIKAKISFGNVQKGDIGGYVESEKNLHMLGNAWIYGNARIFGNAQIYGNARIYGDAWIFGNARIYGDAWIYGDAQIFWASKVGSENGTLTVFNCIEGIKVTRGRFIGTPKQFLDKSKKTHGVTSKIHKEYKLLIKVAKSRIEGAKHDN